VLAVLLARSVADEICGPAEELLHENVEQVPEGSILEEVVDLLECSLLLLDLLLLLGDHVGRCEADLRAGLGNEDLIALHRAGGSVVTSVL
jgi:hypothetical protein